MVVAIPAWSYLALKVLIVAGIQSDVYLGRLAVSFSLWLDMAISAISGIYSANQGILAKDYQWHWRAFLAPAVPMLFASTLFSILGGDLEGSMKAVTGSIVIPGTYGVLGTYAYLYLGKIYMSKNYNIV